MKGSIIKMERQSPVHLPGKPKKTKLRSSWPVVLEYADEGPGPWVVDLSHCQRWDIQGRELSEALAPGVSFPDAAGGIALHSKGLIGRTSQRQAFLWHFDDNDTAPSEIGCTEVTEGGFCLALLGRDVFKITEKLTSLDLNGPKRTAPFLLLGPFAHVTGQLVVLMNDPADAMVLVAAARGYAHDMVHAVLAAGEEFGLHPAGETKFKSALNSIIDRTL